MPRFLVHIHTGPADPNKATLGCLVALAAARKGHDVTVFFAGDGVHLLAPDHAGIEGAGTGRLGDHLIGLAETGARFRVSGMSAKARGYDEALLDGHPAEFAMPDTLVDLAQAADTLLCY
ncbi:DsrE family protein [Limimaricola sp.]|uniref:DsrE family protein n=1 Tax=Limimaricola sp. TaxID=2211665 RepID=UPI004058E5A5